MAASETASLKQQRDQLMADNAALVDRSKALDRQLFDTKAKFTALAGQATDPRTREVAQITANQVTPITAAASATVTDRWFAVVESDYDLQVARRDAADFKRRWPEATFRIFNASDGSGQHVYAITVGGPGTKDAANQALAGVRDRKLARDAFVWRSVYWTEVL